MYRVVLALVCVAMASGCMVPDTPTHCQAECYQSERWCGCRLTDSRCAARKALCDAECREVEK